MFLTFVVPKMVICDNGPQFRSKEFAKLTEAYRIQIKYNANYHPQVNPTERVNRTVKTMLSIYAKDNHRNWDDNLSVVTCALRTARHEAIKVTPYSVNFGREMILKGTDHDRGIDDQRETEVVDKSGAFEELFRDIRKRLDAAACFTVTAVFSLITNFYKVTISERNTDRCI